MAEKPGDCGEGRYELISQEEELPEAWRPSITRLPSLAARLLTELRERALVP